MKNCHRSFACRFTRLTAAALVAAATLTTAGRLSAQESQTFVGTITDEMCNDTNHGAMRMGSTDEDCAKACVDAHGATWVLYDGKNTFGLSDQKAAGGFAAKRVRVTGTLDSKTRKITVTTMRAEP